MKRVSSRQQDLRFVPLAGAHYTVGECCFSCGFPSLSWVRAESWSTKEGKSMQPPKGAEPYLFYRNVFTPALVFIRSQERMGGAPFP